MCFVVGGATTKCGSVARRIVTIQILSIVVETSASAWYLFPKINRNFIRNEPIYCRYFGHRSPAAVVALTPRQFIHKGVSITAGNKQASRYVGAF